MADNRTRGSSGGIGLTTLFVVLKLTDLIDWSWWWVLSPIWICLALIIIVLGLYGLAGAFADSK